MCLRDVQGFLFDMDGVLYNSEAPIEGAAEVVSWAGAQGIPHLFVTNTTSRSRAALVEKLARFGIPASASQIHTPCAAAAHWLRCQPPGPVALFVRPAAQEEFAGLPILATEAESGAAYVVIGDLGDAWDYRTLNRAFRVLYSAPDAKLIALGMTRYWQTADGLSLDVAPFIVALEHAAGRKAIVLGKPATAFFRAAGEALKLSPDAVAMIGDDIQTDIAGAQAAGMKAVLVKTGKFRPADLDGTIKPDAILESVAELPRLWSKRDAISRR